MIKTIGLACALGALVTTAHAAAKEIPATPRLIEAAKKSGCGDPEPRRCEYHFRRSGNRVLACAWDGGNSGFCIRTPPSVIRRIDAEAEDMCRHGSDIIPHSTFGEADLGYACKNGHMIREPYTRYFDAEGYKAHEWRRIYP